MGVNKGMGTVDEQSLHCFHTLLHPCAIPPVCMGVVNSAGALHGVSICQSSGLFLQHIS